MEEEAAMATTSATLDLILRVLDGGVEVVLAIACIALWREMQKRDEKHEAKVEKLVERLDRMTDRAFAMLANVRLPGGGDHAG